MPTNQLELGFMTNLNNLMKFSIPRANASLSAGAIKDAMDAMIATNIVTSDLGLISQRDSATMYTTTKTEFATA